MELFENMVLQYVLQDNKKIRIIFINRPLNYCYVVSLEGSTAMPQFKLIDEINRLIKSEELIVVPEPYNQMFYEDEISDRHKLLRDEYWNIIEYLWNENKDKFLIKASRSKIIKDTSIKYKVQEMQVKRIITRFLQRGMKKNSLLPDYIYCGGKGKLKKAGNKKRGRKRIPEKNGEIVEGINVDETILNIIRISINLFYAKKEKKPLAEAYTYMLEKFFSDKRKFNNIEKNYVWDKSRIPTYRSFVYWYHYLEDKDDKRGAIIKRESKKYFDLHNRELLGNSTMDAWGPGSRYQIDATVADVYLVSKIDRKRIIGRPVVYSVIDVFSRLICGIYIGLEGPSWIGAMMALDNVIEDKVEFCFMYGINITSEQWPNSYFGEKILADRGEFEGFNVENLINNLYMKIENTSPYRGDLKGIVERNFRTINEKIKHKTPGAIAKEFRERGDRDYRLDAVLDIKEFTAIIINEVINHNNSIITDYQMDVELVKDEIPPVPVMIWNWGIQHRRCAFKYVEKDLARLNLMYRKKVTITRKGIQFNTKMYYGCEIALKEQWYLKRTGEKINIVYDPRNMNFIYIPINNGASFIKCTLLDKNSKYKDLSEDETIFIQELEKESINSYKNEQNQVNVDYVKNTERIIKRAKEKTKISIEKDSDRKRLKDIRKNRAEEKENIRDVEAFVLDRIDDNGSSINKNYGQKLDKYDDDEVVSKLDLFKKVKGDKVEK